MYIRWDPREDNPKKRRSRIKTFAKKNVKPRVLKKKTYKRKLREGRKFIIGDHKRIYVSRYYKGEKFYLYRNKGAYTYYYTRGKFRGFLKKEKKYLRKVMRKKGSPYKYTRRRNIEAFGKTRKKTSSIKKYIRIPTKNLLPIKVKNMLKKTTLTQRLHWRNFGYRRLFKIRKTRSFKKKQFKPLVKKLRERIKSNASIKKQKRIEKISDKKFNYRNFTSTRGFIITATLTKQNLLGDVKNIKLKLKRVPVFRKRKNRRVNLGWKPIIVEGWKRIAISPKTKKNLAASNYKPMIRKPHLFTLLESIKNRSKDYERYRYWQDIDETDLEVGEYSCLPQMLGHNLNVPFDDYMLNKLDHPVIVDVNGRKTENKLIKIQNIKNRFTGRLNRLRKGIRKKLIIKLRRKPQIINPSAGERRFLIKNLRPKVKNSIKPKKVLRNRIKRFVKKLNKLKTPAIKKKIRKILLVKKYPFLRRGLKIAGPGIKKLMRTRKRKVVKNLKILFKRFLKYIKLLNRRKKLLRKLGNRRTKKRRQRFMNTLVTPLILVPFAIACKMEIGEKIINNNQNQKMKYYLMGIRNTFAIYNLTIIILALRMTLMNLVSRMLIKVRTIINYAGNSNLSDLPFRALEQYPRREFLITWRKWTGGLLTNFKRISKRIISRIHNQKFSNITKQINVHYPKNIPQFPGYMLAASNHHWALNESKNVRIKTTQLVEMSHLGDFADINLPFNRTYFSLKSLTFLIQETSAYVKTLRPIYKINGIKILVKKKQHANIHIR